jgi:thymidylate synthase
LLYSITKQKTTKCVKGIYVKQNKDILIHFVMHEEQQYLDLIRTILEKGTWEEGRNGRTKSIFGSSMRFSLADGQIPILTTKKTAWKTCLKELLWFIRGETDNKLLQDQGVHIWDGNTTREFLDSRILH